MSEPDFVEETDIERLSVDERPLLARTYETVEIAADGRNVELLCAPFDVPVQVQDPGGHPYMEEFARGAFARSTKAPHHVLLEFEHFHPGLSGVIGRGEALEERADALYGRFRMGRTQDGDKALELVNEGVLTAASVFFAPIKTARLARDHVRRLHVMLDRVALCRVGSYPGARVLAVRSEQIEQEQIIEFPEAVRPLPFDPELRARLEAAGLAVPPNLR